GFIVAPRFQLGVKRGCHEGKEIGLGEMAQRGNRFSIADTDLAHGEGRLVRGFHLLSDAFVGLFGTLPQRFTLPGEPVPPNTSTFVDCHLVIRPLLQRAMTWVAWFGRTSQGRILGAALSSLGSLPCQDSPLAHMRDVFRACTCAWRGFSVFED